MNTNEEDIRNVSVVIETVTPPIAREYTDKIPKHQRVPRGPRIHQLREDMENGRFIFNGQSIVFDINGNLSDGQHRMLALAEVQDDHLVEIPFVIVRNVPVNCYTTMDNIAKRSSADALKYTDVERATLVAGIATFIDRNNRAGNAYGEFSKANEPAHVSVQQAYFDNRELIAEALKSVAKSRCAFVKSKKMAFAAWLFIRKEFGAPFADYFIGALSEGRSGSKIIQRLDTWILTDNKRARQEHGPDARLARILGDAKKEHSTVGVEVDPLVDGKEAA